MSVLTDQIGAILDNIADVIEGGNAYRGSGTEYKGIPSTRSPDDREVAQVTTYDGSTTTVAASEITPAAASRLIRSDAPPFFLLCTSQDSGSGNTGAARPIVSHDGDNTFTVSPAFAESVASDDNFSVVEGFKRMRDITDIESDDGIDGGLDRVFSLRMLPGRRLPWYGNGFEIFEAELELMIRLLKRGRERTARQSALENIQMMRTIITRLDVRGDYIQLIDVAESTPEVKTDDGHKVVVTDKYRVKYRIDATYK